MEKIDFVNNTTPALNMTNLNKLQDNVEDAIVEAIDEVQEGVTSKLDKTSVKNEYSTSATDTYGCNYVNGIIENGSNSKGSWVKFADGTLIQYGIVSQASANTANSSISAGGYRSSGYDFTFPIEFYEVPKSLITSPAGDLTVSGVLPDFDVGLTKSQFQLIWWSVASNATSRTLKASWQAIGKWK